MAKEEDDIGDQFKQHYALLSMVAFNIVENQEVAKDIVLDFFVWYCQKHNSITLRYSFKSYAIKAVKNLSLQYLEKKERKMSLLKKMDFPTYHLPKLFERNIEEEELQKILEKLPETRREIFISYVISGMSYAEIADTYDISINTVKTQMKRAYAFFKNHVVKKPLISIFLTFLPF